MDAYLDSTHSTTGYPPDAITKANEQEVYEKLYLPEQLKEERKSVKYKYNVGDYVHLSVARRRFHKGYKDSFTQEIFVVDRRIRSHTPRYKIKDMMNEELEGSCYEPELQPAEFNDDLSFPIEKVLYYKVRNKIKMAKVRWQGYPPKFDSFIEANDIERKYVFADTVELEKQQQQQKQV